MEIYKVIFIIVVHIIDVRCKTTIGCNVTRGNLTCSDNKLIHVESISFWLYSGDDCNDDTRTACGQNLTNGDTGLTPRCNGQTSCKETEPGTPSDCNGTTSTVFNYRCINKTSSAIEMCEVIGLDNVNRFFLSSPGYPQLSNNMQGECRCNIRGTNITSITVLDLRLVSAMHGTRSSLYIQYGDNTENITSRINTAKTLYNYKLPLPSATTADIRFSHNQINGLRLWLEIEGIALQVSCNKATTSAPTTTSSPTSQSTPTITSTVTTTSITQTTSTVQSSTSTLLSSAPTTLVSTSPGSDVNISTSPSSTNSSESENISLTSTSTISTFSTQTPSISASSPTAEADKLTGIIVGTVVSGIIIIIVLVVAILCFKIHRKRAAAPPPNVDVHVNVSSNNYFVLEIPKDRDSVPLDAKVDLDYQKSNLNNTKSDSSTNPRYSVVETGQTKNQDYSKVYTSDQKYRPVPYSKPVEDVEILQNDLYIPFQPSLVSKPNPSESPESKEPDPGNITDSNQPSDVEINQPSDIEIMENDLYVSYDNSTANQPSDIEINQPSDIEIMENDLYVSYDNSTANQPSDIKANQPSDIKANQPSDTTANQPADIEINQPSDINANQPSDIEANQPSDIEIMENDLYVSYDASTTARISSPE